MLLVLVVGVVGVSAFGILWWISRRELQALRVSERHSLPPANRARYVPEPLSDDPPQKAAMTQKRDLAAEFDQLAGRVSVLEQKLQCEHENSLELKRQVITQAILLRL